VHLPECHRSGTVISPSCERSVAGVRAFLDAHAALILQLARGMVREQGEAAGPEDVAQEVTVALLKMHAAGTFDPARVENPEAYLRVVVRNAAHRSRRRRSVVERVGHDGDTGEMAEEGERLAPESVPSPEDTTRRALDARHTLEALKRELRPRDALVLALLVEEGLGIEEVAERLGTTLNNVYQMRHRILTAARGILGKEDAPETLDSSRGAI
jgi:RNA polymerase sigma factor (sigma-70 family)